MDYTHLYQFLNYIYVVLGAAFVFYILIPLFLHGVRSPNGQSLISPDALAVWGRVRMVVMLVILFSCGFGAAKQAFQNKVPNADLPDGRAAAAERANAFERKFKK